VCLSSAYFFLWVEWNQVHYYWGYYWPIGPAPDDDGWWWVWSSRWNDWHGKPKYSEQTCPNATLSTTNATWPDPGSNLCHCGGKPVTNHLSYGTAPKQVLQHLLIADSWITTIKRRRMTIDIDSLYTHWVLLKSSIHWDSTERTCPTRIWRLSWTWLNFISAFPHKYCNHWLLWRLH
jgi:hypothetical protein